MPKYHSAAQLVILADKFSAAYIALRGTSASGYGAGDGTRTYAMELKVADLADIVEGTTDAAFRDLLQQELYVEETKAMYDAALLDPVFSSVCKRFYNAWRNMSKNGSVLSATVTGLDTLLSYYNVVAVTKWQSLCPPEFRLANFAVSGLYPAVQNVYFEVLQGATYPNGLRKLLVGTGQTAGFAVDQAKYAGGFPQLIVSGFAGAPATVTVTGTQFDPATKTFTAGKTWTVTVTGNGTFTLVPGGGSPAATDSLIAAVSDIAAGGAITAPTTIYAEARRPAGRTYPPT